METRFFTIELDERAEGDEKREVWASLSSEVPVTRGGIEEILDHSPEAINLERMPLPVLDSHDTRRLPIGVIEKVEIMGGKLRGLLRFGSRKAAREVWEDVRDRVIRGVSIGYTIEEKQKSAKGYRAIRWTPFEASLCAVPADCTVGINRKIEEKEERSNEMKYLEVIGQKKEEKFRNAGEFLTAVMRAGINGGSVDPRLVTRAGSTESVGSDGGFLVGENLLSPVWQKVYEKSTLPSFCKRITLSGNSNTIKIPRVAKSSRVNGSRAGGVNSYYLAEGAQITDSKPSFEMLEISLLKLACLGYATDELLQDANALQQVVFDAFADEVAFKVADGIIRGNGAGQPLGILNAPALVTASKVQNQTADTVVYANILAMWQRIPAKCRANAVWLVSPDAEAQLFQMSLTVGDGGSAVYLPSGGASSAPYSTLFGRPVIVCEQSSALGDVGDIILADLSQYLIVDKGTPEFAASAHVRFDYDQMAFRFIYRFNGMPMWSKAVTPFKGSNKLSPFVTLEAR